jgi:hypothetical protein
LTIPLFPLSFFNSAGLANNFIDTLEGYIIKNNRKAFPLNSPTTMIEEIKGMIESRFG